MESKNRLVVITEKTVVNKDLESVFNFFANPGNDSLWRAEINRSTLDGALQVGVTVSERSYLSKKTSDNLIELKCTAYDKNKVAVFETIPNAEFYQKSQRQVTFVSDEKTEVIYTFCFDLSIVKFALGFALPKFIVSFKAESDMKKYLRKLKEQLEQATKP